ncbi:hypothetical protein EPK99_12845 [Neorhizobium lilium]|uniref:Uncharacterized protein n=1 Tax=Neorhizobium lilium TaxID=2503024 RepID=A0A3S3VH95_9HYPH|nr:hypothetical protein [Neorhizobium lilium]RWX76571.1 hypothetical protein EPK99_12845 [Neorhizobium lilium]
MLPPVSAIGVITDIPVPAAQPVATVRVSPIEAANDQDAAALPVSGGRLGAMSLSAQLQLAQGFSIFAETIGALLKLPRAENEGLADYAKRIVAAVQALTPSQQALLETSLNQLVRGVTLRLLTDILKNPAGPETARLTALLQLAPFQGKDLAATAAVTSYLQNEGTEPSLSKTFLGAAAASPVAPGVSSAASQPLSPRTALPAPGATPVAVQQAEDSSASVSAVASDDTSAKTVAIKAQNITLAAAAVVLQQEDSSASVPAQAPSTAAPGNTAAISAIDEQKISPDLAPTFAPPRQDPAQALTFTNVQVSSSGVAAAPTAADPAVFPQAPPIPYLSEPAFDQIKAEAIAVADALAKLPRADNAEATALGSRPNLAFSAPVTAEFLVGDPLAAQTPEINPDRKSEARSILQTQDIASPARRLGQNAVLAITQWLADVFSAETWPKPSGSGLPRSEGNGSDAFLASLIANRSSAPIPVAPHHGDLAKAAIGAGQAPNAVEEADLDSFHTASIVPAKAVASAKADFPDTLPMVLPMLVPREGIPLPFVPYPPATEQKQNREGRKTKEVTKLDEEGEEPPPGQQSFHGHEQDKGQPREKQEERGGSGVKAEGEDDGSANDFYWRMAGWT